MVEAPITWKAVAVAGKVVGPCGIAVPLVLSQDGKSISPLDTDGPVVRAHQTEELASGGFITLLERPIAVSTGHRIAWVTRVLLNATKDAPRIWRSLDSAGTPRLRFSGDVEREVTAAPAEPIAEVFDSIEESIVHEYRIAFITGSDHAELLSRFQDGLRATLFTSRSRPRRREETLQILGHLFRINGLAQKLETLHRLKLAVPPYKKTYPEFLQDIDTLEAVLRKARENEAERMRCDPMRRQMRSLRDDQVVPDPPVSAMESPVSRVLGYTGGDVRDQRWPISRPTIH